MYNKNPVSKKLLKKGLFVIPNFSSLIDIPGFGRLELGNDSSTLETPGKIEDPKLMEKKFQNVYKYFVEVLGNNLGNIPVEERKKIRDLINNKSIEEHNENDIKTIFNYLQKYKDKIDPEDRKDLQKIVKEIGGEETIKYIKNNFKFDIGDFYRPTTSEVLSIMKNPVLKDKERKEKIPSETSSIIPFYGIPKEKVKQSLGEMSKKLTETKEELKRTKEQLEQKEEELKTVKGTLGKTQKQLEQKEEELKRTKERLSETAKKLGVTTKQLKETQETLSQETARKRALGRVIRYGVPGVGGLTAGYLFGPIWGPILGGGSGVLSTLLTQSMEGESLTNWKAYWGPVGLGVGTGLVGSLFKHVIEKRRKNIKNE